MLVDCKANIDRVFALDSLGTASAYYRYHFFCLGWKALKRDLLSCSLLQWSSLLKRKWNSAKARISIMQGGTSALHPSARQGQFFELEAAPPWAGPLYLVISSHTRRWRFLFPRFGWSEDCHPDLRIRYVQAGHNTIIMQPPETLFRDLQEG
jgi:hypothetical protein